MKRTSLAVLMVALALVALAAPMAYAQAPATKVTINGIIDSVSSLSRNMSTVDLNYSRTGDKEWYARSRGRFDIIGEIGKARAVLGLEIDATWGQTGNADSAAAGSFACAANTGTGGIAGAVTCPQQRFGAQGGFDLNTDVPGIIEIKWLYTEFPLPLIPVPTVVRLGAQPWAATYKLAVLANGDFAGVNLTSTITPNVKLNFAYAQVEEAGSGADDFPWIPGSSSQTSYTQARGEDFAIIASVEVTPFKGLDLRPIYSYFYANGATNIAARQGRGGLSVSSFNATFRAPGMDENRHTVGLDARLRMGPFSLDPTVFFQFGDRETNDTTAGGTFTNPVRRRATRSAWLADVRAGFQLGPALLEAMGMYTTGNKAQDNLRSGRINFFEPISTDTSYYAGWAEIFALGIDYFNILYGGTAGLNPGVAIGYDRYGRQQFGARATYAITPAFSVRGGVTAAWTDQKVDTDSILAINAGLIPQGNTRGEERYLGTEVNAGFTWRFAPGLTFDMVGAYLFAGDALRYARRCDGACGTNVLGLDNITNGRHGVSDVYTVATRVRYAF